MTLTQNRSVVHDDTADPVESGASAAALAAADLVTLTATATDGDGDTDDATANIGDAFTFEDDGPTVTAEGTAPTLTTDDTDIPDTTSADFSTIFSASFGTDGFKDSDDNDVQDADALAYTLGVKSAGVDSGLDDTISGDNILLRLNAGGAVEGYLENDTATVAFLISVDATGQVTLTQNRSVVHDDTADPVESGASAAALAAADLVTLTATATDGDGDTDDATANIGDAFTFEDDGPTVTAEGTAPTLTTDDTDIPDTTSADFSTIFSASFGTDGFKDSDDNDVQDADALAYTLGVKSAGVDSGLDDTISGDNILLRLNAGGAVEGYLENDTATVAFLISVDATGQVTLTQNRSVVHDDTADPVESGASAAALAAADLVTLTATATDGDGDTDDATANIGDAFTFEDDGPTVTAEGTAPTLTTDDTDIPDTTSADFSTIFSASFGTDGFKDSDDNDVQDADALAYTLGVKSAGVDSGLDDTISGDNILLRLNAGGAVEGYLENDTATVAFLISVDATGQVTLTQNRSVVHDDTADPVESGASAAALAAADLVTLTATATDGDGDTDDATANIGDAFTFEDDGPTVTAEGTAPTLTTDDTDIPDTTSADFSTIFSASFGTDGFKDSDDNDVQDADALAYTLGVKSAGVDSGLDDTISGDNILLRLNAGGAVEGYLENDTATVAFLISVDATGQVTLTQNRSVVHDDTADPVESGASAAALAAADLVTLTATATDGDGDTDDATANIGDAFTFEDDGPTVTAEGTEPTLTVDESSLGDNDANFSTVFTSNAGADGDDITYELSISQVTNDSGLIDTLTGQSVLLFVEGDDVVGRAGSAAGDIVFTVSVAADGTVTLDQARAVIHSPDTGPDQETTLALDDLVTLTATITDGDGDQAVDSVDIGTSLIFKDDAPAITVPFDGDQDAGNGTGTPETLANTAGASATGAFGYDIGADAHTAAFYAGGGSDFVDQNPALAGVQIGLSGTIVGGGGGNVLTPEVTLQSESATSATFNFSFTYDQDPAAGLQAGTAGGTLVFDKVADTYTITLTDPLEGFTFDIIHTSELLSKEPTSNSGHPQIVLEKLQADDPNTPNDEDFLRAVHRQLAQQQEQDVLVDEQR